MGVQKKLNKQIERIQEGKGVKKAIKKANELAHKVDAKERERKIKKAVEA